MRGAHLGGNGEAHGIAEALQLGGDEELLNGPVLAHLARHLDRVISISNATTAVDNPANQSRGNDVFQGCSNPASKNGA